MNTIPICAWHSKKSDTELLKVKELLLDFREKTNLPSIIKKVREKMKINFGIDYSDKKFRKLKKSRSQSYE